MEKILTRIAIIIIMISLVSCQQENPIQDRNLETKERDFSDCKTTTKSTDSGEYIEYSTIDSNYLQIKHFNISLNCCPDSIIINSRIEDGAIVYNICHQFPNCNCDCPYDVSCVIGPLDYSMYNFKILVCGEETKSFLINFNKTTNRTISIN